MFLLVIALLVVIAILGGILFGKSLSWFDVFGLDDLHEDERRARHAAVEEMVREYKQTQKAAAKEASANFDQAMSNLEGEMKRAQKEMGQFFDKKTIDKAVFSEPGADLCAICKGPIDFYTVPVSYAIIGAYKHAKATEYVSKFVHVKCRKASGQVT